MPNLVLDRIVTERSPDVSVVVTVYNQESIIQTNLQSLATSANVSWELIVVDDSSEDTSLSEVVTAAEAICSSSASLARFRVYKNPLPRFETYCDSFGIAVAEAKIVVLCQADMRILDDTFMERVGTALRNYPDLLMVSGRGVRDVAQVSETFRRSKGSDLRTWTDKLIEKLQQASKPTLKRTTNSPGLNADQNASINQVIFPTKSDFEAAGRAGRLGRLIEHEPGLSEEVLRKVWVGDSVIRGPLGINRDLFAGAGGFDTKAFFQGYDDHDLCVRAQLQLGLRVGYLPINFSSPLSWGTTRKGRPWRSSLALIWEKIRTSRRRRNSYLWRLGLSSLEVPLARPEIRPLNLRPPTLKAERRHQN